MKTFAFAFKVVLRWLLLPGFLCASLLCTQPARAAGPCSLEHVHHGSITSDETWCANGDSTHWLDGDLVVQAGVTLTIEDGVTVDSASDAWSKYLIVQGHLDINGTAAHPVLLTRSINYPNQNWSGLFFDGSQGDGSGTINYATINHAGSNFLPSGCTGTCGSAQTAVFVKDLPDGKQVTINHSTITDNTSKGLFVVDSTVSISNTTFSQNRYPVWIEGEDSVVTYSDNIYTGNAYPYYDSTNYTIHEDAIILGSNALMGQSFSLPSQNGLDAYVFFSGAAIPSGTTMTIEPGVTLHTVSDRYVSVQGNLEAIGTTALPILFSGIPSSVPGVNLYWGGLYFDGTAGDGGGTIRHAVIDRGGCNYLPPGCAGKCGTAQTAIFVKDVSANSPLSMRYSTIQDSLGKGLFVVDSPGLQFENNLIMGGRVGADIASNITLSNLAITEPVLDGIIVENGYNVDACHLTIARTGQSGLHLYNSATATLRNSILSHNGRAVWAEGSGSASLNTNLSDANTVFQLGAVTAANTITGSAAFETDGYHIQTTSAAVGVGLSSLASVDIDDDARPWPVGSQPDLGADEISIGAEPVLLKLFLPMVNR